MELVSIQKQLPAKDIGPQGMSFRRDTVREGRGLGGGWELICGSDVLHDVISGLPKILNLQ